MNKSIVNKESKKKVITAMDYCLMGLLCFGALAFDFIAIIIDTFIYGNGLSEKHFENPWYVNVTHWSIVIVLWVGTIVMVVKWLKDRNELDNMFNLRFNKKTLAYIILGIIAGIIITIFEGVISGEKSFPQIVREYNRFHMFNGDKAIIVSLFQNIYYIIEVGLVVLLIAFMQRAGEEWFTNKNIPYGGIGLMFTWGLGHFSKGILAMSWISMFALVAGALFILNKKSIWATYVFILITFFI